MLRFDDPISFMQGATPSVVRSWHALDIVRVGDLLSAIPRRYDDYSTVTTIQNAEAGATLTLRGRVAQCKKLSTFRRRFQVFRLVLEDATGSISATFFNQPWILSELVPGREIFLSGKVTLHPRYGKHLMHPLWEPADQKTFVAGSLAPVYGLAGTLAQKTYRRLMRYALDHLEPLAETFPATLLARLGLPGRREAFLCIHAPETRVQAELGRRRAAFEELFVYQLALHQARLDADKAGGIPISFDQRFSKNFVASLPFSLTGDQKRAMWAAFQDMQNTRPMRRLLQGDVGSGKTVVAVHLAAATARAGFSAALLAPTDLLAHQHAITWRRFLARQPIPLVLVTRTEKRWMMGGEEKTLSNQELESCLEQGQALFLGTHALLHKRRLPRDLALAIVDEQHRFGVDQREALAQTGRPDGRMPHFYSMTATPIPRSLALTLFGDLDLSVLREKPKDRIPVRTRVCIGDAREGAYRAMREAVARRERAFVVCPLIDPSDVLGVRSATDEWKRLSRGPLEGLRLGLLHGRLSPSQKEQVMSDFLQGNLDVLVSTSVIEVGIDVPEATVMAIEGAERFGLAQLHQLRGRVGRSHRPSFCFLLTDALGDSLYRLRLLETIDDGLKLAEEDLKQRGSGNLLGTEQSGEAPLRAVSLADVDLIEAAKEEARALLASDESFRRSPWFSYWSERINRLRSTGHLE